MDPDATSICAVTAWQALLIRGFAALVRQEAASGPDALRDLARLFHEAGIAETAREGDRVLVAIGGETGIGPDTQAALRDWADRVKARMKEATA